MRNGREGIMNAAIRLFAEKGYAGTSVREICRDAGITKPVLYYHFRSKEHLYQEIMIGIFKTTSESLLKASKFGGNLREKLVQFLHAEFLDTRKNPVVARFLFRIMFSPDKANPYFNFLGEFERQREVIAGFFLADGKLSPNRRNARAFASALIGMELVAILEHLLTERPTLTRRSAERTVNILMKGCAGV